MREVLQRRRVTVIFYHDPSPAILEKHIAALQRRYHLISLREFVNAHRLGKSRALPPKSLAISFDDGHAGNFRLKQLLADKEVPVTIFLCSGIAGTRRRFWFKHIPGETEHLKHLPDEERVERLHELGFDEALEVAEGDALSADEIKELSSIVDFQSHTVSHAVLPYCSSRKAEREILGSRQQLMDEYGFDVFALSYPNGDYSDRDMSLAKDAGYSCAFTANSGGNSDQTDPFEFKRIGIDDNDGVDELLVKACGIWGFLQRVRKRRDFGYTPQTDLRPLTTASQRD
jgi:peptidoglycan/xylan/chitin deacetylase (PgdA/CDA1 family)